jgi:hypothetical protein
MKAFDGVGLAAAKEYGAPTKHLGASSAAQEIARRIAEQDKVWTKVAQPPAETLKLMRSPVVDGIAETNRLARQGTEATIKSAEHLRVVSDQTAVVAASMAGCRRSSSRRGFRSGRRMQRTTSAPQGGLYWSLSSVCSLDRSSRVGRSTQTARTAKREVARQEVTQRRLQEQLDLARRAEQDRAREAAELRRALEAMRPPAGAEGRSANARPAGQGRRQ